MKDKKILFIYNNNVFDLDYGTKQRMYGFIKYFNERSYQVEQFVPDYYDLDWKNLKDNFDYNLISKIYLNDKIKKNLAEKILTATSNIEKFFCKIFSPKRYAFLRMQKRFFPTYQDNVQNELGKLLKKNKYNYIVATNFNYNKLLKDISVKTPKILLIEDFTSVQAFSTQKYFQNNGNIGCLLNEEVRSVNGFDKAICISSDELFFFSQFATKPEFFYIPAFMETKSQKRNEKFKYDILFIGADNFHNLKAINWFLERVYPNLQKAKILIVGKICKKINQKKYPKIQFIDFVKDLDDVYHTSKIAICPMFSGTGLKIKVVEALSYGKPVVCTSYGVVGMSQKSNNGCLVTNDEKEFTDNIKRLLKFKKFYDRISHQAINFFKNNFSTEANYKQLDKIFK